MDGDPYVVCVPEYEWEQCKAAVGRAHARLVEHWGDGSPVVFHSGEVEETSEGFAVSMVWRCDSTLFCTTSIDMDFQKAVATVEALINRYMEHEWELHNLGLVSH